MLQFLISASMVSILPQVAKWRALDWFIYMAQCCSLAPFRLSLATAKRSQSSTAFTWTMLHDEVDWIDVNWIRTLTWFFTQKIGFQKRAAFDQGVTLVLSLCKHLPGTFTGSLSRLQVIVRPNPSWRACFKIQSPLKQLSQVMCGFSRNIPDGRNSSPSSKGLSFCQIRNTLFGPGTVNPFLWSLCRWTCAIGRIQSQSLINTNWPPRVTPGLPITNPNGPVSLPSHQMRTWFRPSRDPSNQTELTH